MSRKNRKRTGQAKPLRTGKARRFGMGFQHRHAHFDMAARLRGEQVFLMHRTIARTRHARPGRCFFRNRHCQLFQPRLFMMSRISRSNVMSSGMTAGGASLGVVSLLI